MSDIEAGFFSNPEMLVYQGPTVHVDIGIDRQFLIENRPPELTAQRLPALVDTGATESCIDSELAIELNLPAIDQKRVAGVHGIAEVTYRVAQIHIPELPFTIVGNFATAPLRSSGIPHYAVLGRTFLQHFTMVYRGRSGRVTITNDEAV